MSTLLERALADLAAHPDSSAREIARRIGENDRTVYGALDNAAYDGKCQRWHPGGSGGPWLWKIPTFPNEPHGASQFAEKATVRKRPDHRTETPMTTYDQPVQATLQVKLANGKTWEATAEDMKKFGYVERSAAYMALVGHLREILHDAGLIDREVTDARINPIRYIAEVAINYPELLEHRDMADVNARIVEIERHLQATLPEES